MFNSTNLNNRLKEQFDITPYLFIYLPLLTSIYSLFVRFQGVAVQLINLVWFLLISVIKFIKKNSILFFFLLSNFLLLKILPITTVHVATSSYHFGNINSFFRWFFLSGYFFVVYCFRNYRFFLVSFILIFSFFYISSEPFFALDDFGLGGREENIYIDYDALGLELDPEVKSPSDPFPEVTTLGETLVRCNLLNAPFLSYSFRGEKGLDFPKIGNSFYNEYVAAEKEFLSDSPKLNYVYYRGGSKPLHNYPLIDSNLPLFNKNTFLSEKIDSYMYFFDKKRQYYNEHYHDHYNYSEVLLRKEKVKEKTTDNVVDFLTNEIDNTFVKSNYSGFDYDELKEYGEIPVKTLLRKAQEAYHKALVEEASRQQKEIANYKPTPTSEALLKAKEKKAAKPKKYKGDYFYTMLPWSESKQGFFDESMGNLLRPNLAYKGESRGQIPSMNSDNYVGSKANYTNDLKLLLMKKEEDPIHDLMRKMHKGDRVLSLKYNKSLWAEYDIINKNYSDFETYLNKKNMCFSHVRTDLLLNFKKEMFLQMESNYLRSFGLEVDVNLKPEKLDEEILKNYSFFKRICYRSWDFLLKFYCRFFGTKKYYTESVFDYNPGLMYTPQTVDDVSYVEYMEGLRINKHVRFLLNKINLDVIINLVKMTFRAETHCSSTLTEYILITNLMYEIIGEQQDETFMKELVERQGKDGFPHLCPFFRGRRLAFLGQIALLSSPENIKMMKDYEVIYLIMKIKENLEFEWFRSNIDLVLKGKFVPLFNRK